MHPKSVLKENLIINKSNLYRIISTLPNYLPNPFIISFRDSINQYIKIPKQIKMNNSFSSLSQGHIADVKSILSFGASSRILPFAIGGRDDGEEQRYDYFNCSSRLSGQFGVFNRGGLCCRTFFTEGQTIPQAESLIYEFKCYSFPLCKYSTQKLTKTICSFLNSQGGYIFIGIFENTLTKQHKVKGYTYNQAQKQQILKILRKNAESIQPDILLSGKQQICFIPVKSSVYPYPFLPGKFIIKLKIYPGARDQIYSLKNEEGDYIVCMRTQNQVLTYNAKIQFRKLLALQKEKAQNPSYQLRSFSKHQCRKPEDGARLFSQTNRMLPKYKSIERESEKLGKGISVISPMARDRKRNGKKKQKSLDTSINSSISPIQCTSLKSSQTCEQQKNCSDRAHEQKQLKNKSKKQRKREKKNLKDTQSNGPQIFKNELVSVKQDDSCIKNFKQVRIPSNQKNRRISSLQKIQQYKIKPQSYSTQEEKYDSPRKKYKKQNQFMNLGQSHKLSKKYKKSPQNTDNDEDAQIIKIETDPHLHQNYHYKRKDQRCSSNPYKRKIQQIKIYSLQKHLHSSSQANLKQFVCELLQINSNNHMIFGFSGFSQNRLELIRAQFANICEYTYYEFDSLFVYKFDKYTSEAVVKATLLKAINLQPKKDLKPNNFSNKKCMMSVQFKGLKNIDYANTDSKKLLKNFNQNMIYSQQSCELANSHASPNQTTDENPNKLTLGRIVPKKTMQIIVKLAIRLKILKYDTLTIQEISKLMEVLKLAQKISHKKKKLHTIFYEDDKNGTIPKIKQIQFNNLYYSLLVFLELEKNHIKTIFC